MFVFVLFEKNTENEVCVRERHFYWWARDREVARIPESGCRALLPCPMAHTRRHSRAVSCARATAARTAKSFPALVVVGSISPGDFCFCFCKSAVFWGRRACGSGFWSTRKSDQRGAHAHRSEKCPPMPKIALLALKTTRFAIAVWALGGALGGVRADSSRRT